MRGKLRWGAGGGRGGGRGRSDETVGSTSGTRQVVKNGKKNAGGNERTMTNVCRNWNEIWTGVNGGANTAMLGRRRRALDGCKPL